MRGFICTGAFAVALLCALPLVVDDYLLGVALSLCMWIALAQSWSLLSGLSGYISLGHAAFYGIGAYVTVLCWGNIPLWMVVLMAGTACALIALLVGYPVLRVRGPYFVILTFGLAELAKLIVLNVEVALGEAGRILFGSPDLRTLYFSVLLLAALSTVLVYVVRRSRFGLGLLAIREDETAAEAMGVPVARLKVAAFTLSGVIPGMVGALMVLRSTFFEANQIFSSSISFNILVMCIVGGSDAALGPILGVLFLGTLSEVLWASAPELYLILVGVFLGGFVMFAPEGIVGCWRQWAFRRNSARAGA